MGDTDFVLQDTMIAHEVQNARVSINVVSKNSPPTVPEHKADVIFAWCYSHYYHHETDSKCFLLAGAINTIPSNSKPGEYQDHTIHHMFERVLEMQFTKAN